MSALRIILLALAFIAFQAHAAQRNLAVTASGAQAQKRVALVIGNAAYKGAPALRNPVNDAKAMSNALNGLGFEVIEVTDATQKEMNRAITAFGSKLNAETAALFFYAGHGMQVRGKNYIIPVDAQIETEAAVASESVSVDTVLEQLNASPVSIVILDACRNNPFERSFRKMGGGLAQMDAPKGSFIAYATAPGKTAADGGGKNGLFTQELLKYINEPGLDLEKVFKRVRASVAAKSGDAQMPWDSSSMTGEFYFKPGTQQASLVPVPAPSQLAARIKTREQIEDEYWEEIKDSTDLTSFEQYNKSYPDGRYLNTANLKIAQLKKRVQETERPQQQAAQTGGSGPAMVRIPGRNYEMGKYHVTRGEFAKFVSETNYDAGNSCYVWDGSKWDNRSGSNWRNPGFTQDDNHPVACVNWHDAQAYVSWLSKKTGRQYRLPVEAEWEYACNGGSQSEYCGGSDINSVAWYAGNSGGQTHPVGQKQANGYGLYDMSGNVWQWMENKYDDKNDWRALRGGSWYDEPQNVRAASRGSDEPA